MRFGVAGVVFGIVGGCFSVVTAMGATEQSVTDRLALLEAEVLELRENSGQSSGLSQVHIGGYGELHYNNLNGSGGASDKGEIDFHRFVLFVGYDFRENLRFMSELELEHSLAGDGKPGEIELEQAYVELDVSDSQSVRAGLFLVPVGHLNLNHEPPRFYGVERNPVEKYILPTTWWEAGIGAVGALGGGWRYAAAFHSGLNTSTGSTYAVRSGRQKVAKADAHDGAGTLALGWMGAGVSLGGAIQYQANVTQGSDPEAGHAWLGDIHADIRKGPFQLRALYADWSLDGAGPESVDADRQYGWYVEPSVRPIPELGLFIRYNEWDNRAGSDASASKKEQWDCGVNWWPHEQVVFKADYQWQSNAGGKDQDGFNLGVGYEF